MNIKQIIKEEMEDLTKTKKLYVLVGPPSVGKSTWIKSLNNNDVIVINRDEIVEEVAEKNGLTYDEMFITPSSEALEIDDIHPKFSKIIPAPEHMKWTEFAYEKLVKLNGYETVKENL